jgi:hypothetical protein
MKKILVTTIIFSLFGFSLFLNLEPSPMFAASDNDQFQVSMQVNSEISMTGCIGMSTMLPAIGLTQYGSVGTTTCGVNTTNSLGYKVVFLSSTTPMLKSGLNFFTDRATTSAPAVWTNGATINYFGFSVFGTDVDTAYWGSSGVTTCGNPYASTTNLATGLGTLKYSGFTNFGVGTTTITRNTATTGNNPFTICMAAERGNATSVPSGAYFGTTTVTATTL